MPDSSLRTLFERSIVEPVTSKFWHGQVVIDIQIISAQHLHAKEASQSSGSGLDYETIKPYNIARPHVYGICPRSEATCTHYCSMSSVSIVHSNQGCIIYQ